MAAYLNVHRDVVAEEDLLVLLARRGVEVSGRRHSLRVDLLRQVDLADLLKQADQHERGFVVRELYHSLVSAGNTEDKDQLAC